MWCRCLCWRRCLNRRGSLNWCSFCGLALWINVLYLPCTNRVVPPTIVFPCRNVEMNLNQVVVSDVELLEFVSTENLKAYFLWVLLLCFDYILARLPLLSCSLAYAALYWQCCDCLSNNLHSFFICCLFCDSHDNT